MVGLIPPGAARAPRLPLALLLVACAASCVRVSWISSDRQTPLPEVHVAGLEPGATTLEEALARLGAPLFVWEADPRSYGLAFGWDEGLDWGVNVSVPIAREFSASLDYEDTNLQLEGLVLFFDVHDRLLRVERGLLSDLVPVRERRPADLPDQLGASHAGGGGGGAPAPRDD